MVRRLQKYAPKITGLPKMLIDIISIDHNLLINKVTKALKKNFYILN